MGGSVPLTCGCRDVVTGRWVRAHKGLSFTLDGESDYSSQQVGVQCSGFWQLPSISNKSCGLGHSWTTQWYRTSDIRHGIKAINLESNRKPCAPQIKGSWKKSDVRFVRIGANPSEGKEMHSQSGWVKSASRRKHITSLGWRRWALWRPHQRRFTGQKCSTQEEAVGREPGMLQLEGVQRKLGDPGARDTYSSPSVTWCPEQPHPPNGVGWSHGRCGGLWCSLSDCHSQDLTPRSQLWAVL